MASKLNVTHQAVSKWENGLALPDVQTLMNWPVLFGVSIGQILSGGKRASHVRRDHVEEDRTAPLRKRGRRGRSRLPDGAGAVPGQ